jgi:hypothetical protein
VTARDNEGVVKAVVVANGAKLGISPLREKVAAGPYRITVKAAGYHPWKTRIVVRANGETKVPVELKLKRRPKPK